MNDKYKKPLLFLIPIVLIGIILLKVPSMTPADKTSLNQSHTSEYLYFGGVVIAMFTCSGILMYELFKED